MAVEESKYTFPELDGEEKLIAAVKHLANALASNKNLTDEVRGVLVDLGTQLSSILQLDQKKRETISDIENLLDAVQEQVMRFESDQYMVWDIAGSDEAFEYLNAVDEARKLVERLESLSLDDLEDEEKRDKLQRRAHDVLQNAMVRLEEGFKYILVQSRQAFEPTSLSCSEGKDSFGSDSIEGSVYKDCISIMSEEIIDVIDNDAITRLKRIALLMFSSRCDKECTQAYIGVRENALEECLLTLEVDEKLSIEELRGMNWEKLKFMVKRWIHAMRIFVRVFLASEICLCDKIFGELGSVTLCFIKASKGSMLQLLDFGDTISVGGPKNPECLFTTLNMYEMLADLLPYIESFYMEEEGSSVTMKYHEVVRKLGDHVRATYTSFENALISCCSTTTKSGKSHPFPDGNIQPLTRYVMNYIKVLAEYSQTVNVLFKDHKEERDHTKLLSPDPIQTTSIISSSSSSKLTPIGCCFLSVATILEHNLDAKSKLYDNAALRYFFLMNNVNYMARKVKGSELKSIFGDEWIRKHNWICHKYAMEYERASWASTLLLLKMKEMENTSSATWKILVKERLRSFYLAFEEIYRTQTAWTVNDEELREDLRISISLKVIPAYRSFIGRFCSTYDKYIKYSADDLENYLLDLFEGSRKSM